MISLEKIPAVLKGDAASGGLGDEIIKRWNREVDLVALVTGESSFDKNPLSRRILEQCKENSLDLIRLRVPSEPSVETIDAFSAELKSVIRKGKKPVVAAVGGGSVIDAAKAAGACATMEHSVQRYLEGVGDLAPSGSRLPLIAIPTTSGTGSEATMNSVISSVGPSGFKKSMRHSNFIPDLVIFDPLFMDRAGYNVTAPSGWDAVTQLLEAAVSVKAHQFTDFYSFSGLAMAAHAFPAVCSRSRRIGQKPEAKELNARMSMAIAAFHSGIALANAGLGLVHGAASPLGALHPAPHGVVCGLLLPPVSREMIKVTGDEGKRRYAMAGFILSGRAFCKEDAESSSSSPDRIEEGAGLLLDTLDRWKDDYPLPGLRSYGYGEDDIAAMVPKCSMKNSPASLSNDTILKILQSVL
jgi:alcohol dehydrogenase class IV